MELGAASQTINMTDRAAMFSQPISLNLSRGRVEEFFARILERSDEDIKILLEATKEDPDALFLLYGNYMDKCAALGSASKSELAAVLDSERALLQQLHPTA